MKQSLGSVFLFLAICWFSIAAFPQSQTAQTPPDKPKEEAKAPKRAKAPKQTKEDVTATEKTKLPMPSNEEKTAPVVLNPPLRKYKFNDDAIRADFFQSVPPASCSEWATFSDPKGYPEDKCKKLGGKNCCARCNSPAYDIGPTSGGVKINEPFKMHVRIRHLGVGDYVIYGFGKVDWGDNSQQDVFPFGQDVELSHPYDTANTFTVHVMGGAQFKYQGDGSCSYECCVDNSIDVLVSR